MSDFGSESDGYICASPSPTTRKNGPFFDAAMILSDDAALEQSFYQENGVLSQYTQSDDQSREPVPTTSTPDLSLVASSSPDLFSSREPSPSLHATNFDRPRCGGVAHHSKSTSDHTSFVRRLDYLLQQAADQQSHPGTSDNVRIQPNSPEEVPGPESQMVSIAHDVVPESALGQRVSDRRLSPLPSQEFWRYSNPLGGTSNDSTLATVPGDAGFDSRRNKRRAKAAVNGGSEASSTSPFRDRDPSDSYLSASDGGPPASSRCLVGRHPPSKKRKCLSLDMDLSVVSPCAGSPALSDTNSISSKSSSIQSHQGSEFNTTHDTTEGDVMPSRSRISSAAGPVLSYPPTQPVTPVLGLSPVLSPVPVLGPQDFSRAEIPRIFLSSDDAAKARLMSLLKKETLYRRREGLDALSALDFASPNAFIKEVIAWILTVEPPLGSPTASSIRGRAHSYDLHEQLTLHHDSRFLAVLIFSLFFFIPARGDPKNPLEIDRSDIRHSQELKEGKDVVFWDHAVAAIALAVKMQRDNHPPLKPIFGNHFLALAHHEMLFEDLELAQRNLLRYFSYNLGMPTPQAFLDELRVALPTLRHALESEHEWEDVLKETWKQLIAAAHWPSMLRFPVSLLTATALIEAIKRVIRRRLSLTRLNARAEGLNSTYDGPIKHAAPGVPPEGSILEHNLELGLLRATSAALEDIREVLGFSTEKTDECEKWLAMVRSASENPVRSKYFLGFS